MSPMTVVFDAKLIASLKEQGADDELCYDLKSYFLKEAIKHTYERTLDLLDKVAQCCPH